MGFETGSSNQKLQKEGNVSLENIEAQTIDIPNVIATEGGIQPTKGLVIMGHTGAGVVKHILVDNKGVQSTKVNSSALPTGASTEAKQDVCNNSLSNIENNTNIFYIEDVEENTSVESIMTFIGKQKKNGVWLIQKVVESTLGTTNNTSMEYASVLNNATKTTYASAWTDRAILTYSEIKNLL